MSLPSTSFKSLIVTPAGWCYFTTDFSSSSSILESARLAALKLENMALVALRPGDNMQLADDAFELLSLGVEARGFYDFFDLFLAF